MSVKTDGSSRESRSDTSDSAPKRELLKQERFYAIILVIIFYILSGIVLSLEHGLSYEEPHLKDEEGFYPWAEHYTEGIYSIPIDEVSGRYQHKNSISINPESSKISIASTIGDYDGEGDQNDLAVIVTYTNGTPIPDAEVRLFLPSQQFSNGTTDSSGMAIIYKLPWGVHPISVFIPVEDGPAIILKDFVESMSNKGIYGIYSVVDIEYLTQQSFNNSVVRLESKDRLPIMGLTVSFNNRIIGVSSLEGLVTLSNVKASWGLLNVVNSIGNPVEGVVIVIGNEVVGETDDKGNIQVWSEYNVLLDIRVIDSFEQPVENVAITIDNTKTPVGFTDNNGNFNITTELQFGEYAIDAIKIVDGYEIPLASGIGEVDGEFHYTNHWPPGPSILIAGLIILGIEYLFGVIMMTLMVIGVYGVAKRCFGWPVAFISAVVAMVNGVVLMLFWGQWMGDLATAAFAIFGFLLFVEGIAIYGNGQTTKRSFIVGLTLTFLAGIMFATAVAMRYSSIVLCVIPLIYYLHHLIIKTRVQDNEKQAGSHKKRQIGVIKNRIKRLFAKSNFKKTAILILPYLLGLILIGILIADYNTTYYGGPFNSGYQSSRTLMTVSETTDSDNITFAAYSPQENFFKTYFEYSENELENIPNVMSYIFIFIPIFFLAIPAMVIARKNPLTSAFIVWVILIFMIYLSQGWVCTNVVRDIRYYLPIIPPCSILFGYGIIELIKVTSNFQGSFKNLKKLVYPSIVALATILILSSGVIGAHDTVAPILDGGLGQPKQPLQYPLNEIPIEVNISQLRANPMPYLEKKVLLVNVSVTEVININLYRIKDSVELDNKRTILLDLHEINNPALNVNARLDIVGVFIEDKREPGNWILIVEQLKDLKIIRNTRSQDYSYCQLEIHDSDEITMSYWQQLPPQQPDNQPPKPPLKTPPKPVISKDERLMWILNLLAAGLFFALLIVSKVINLAEKRKELYPNT